MSVLQPEEQTVLQHEEQTVPQRRPASKAAAPRLHPNREIAARLALAKARDEAATQRCPQEQGGYLGVRRRPWGTWVAEITVAGTCRWAQAAALASKVIRHKSPWPGAISPTKSTMAGTAAIHQDSSPHGLRPLQVPRQKELQP